MPFYRLSPGVSDSTGGTYTLVLSVPETTVTVGALGTHGFEAGWYAYVGSALGPGGFARVDRHRKLAAGERDGRHWHIDSLLGQSGVRLDAVWQTAGVDGECAVAARVDGEPIPDFGCSDCDCHSHLFFTPDRASLRETVEDAHGALDGDTAVIEES
jgi:Uri superfamily endonuclease